jgi:hypothetical protein
LVVRLFQYAIERNLIALLNIQRSEAGITVEITQVVARPSCKLGRRRSVHARVARFAEMKPSP